MQPLHDLVNKRVQNITKKELLEQAAKFNVSVTDKQAHDFIHWLSTHKVDLFSEQKRTELFQTAERILGKREAVALEDMLRPYKHFLKL
jgi:glutamyl/glutaminyl-tRNA synthetase